MRPLSKMSISVSRGRVDGSSPTAWLQRSASIFVQPRPDDEASCLPVTNFVAACPRTLTFEVVVILFSVSCYQQSRRRGGGEVPSESPHGRNPTQSSGVTVFAVFAKLC